MTRVILGLGSNLGDRADNIKKALLIIFSAFTADKVSRVYSSSSLLKDNQRDYYNIVCSCYTDKSPEESLIFFQSTEEKLGRVRNGTRWGAREIDIDILDWGGSVIKTDRLIIPHPEMSSRSFVLYPLRDVFPDYKHPETGRSLEEMISLLKDDFGIMPLSNISFDVFENI